MKPKDFVKLGMTKRVDEGYTYYTREIFTGLWLTSQNDKLYIDTDGEFKEITKRQARKLINIFNKL